MKHSKIRAKRMILDGDGEFSLHFVGACTSHNENRGNALFSSRNPPPLPLCSCAERVAVLFDNHKIILYNIYRK